MKKITAAALAAVLAVGVCMTCLASEPADVSGEETAQEENKVIGEKTEEAQVLELTNGSGKDITAFAVKAETDGEEYSENLLAPEDVFADGETRTFFFAAKSEADTQDGDADGETEADAQDGTADAEAVADTQDSAPDGEAGTDAQEDGELQAIAKPEKALALVRLTFADGTTAEFRLWDLDISVYEIRLEEETAYLVCEKDGQELSTLEWERAEAETEEAPADEEEIVEYDDYYEDPYYEDTYYEDTYYEDTYYDDSAYYGGDGGGDSCLQGGLMN